MFIVNLELACSLDVGLYTIVRILQGRQLESSEDVHNLQLKFPSGLMTILFLVVITFLPNACFTWDTAINRLRDYEITDLNDMFISQAGS